MSSSSRFPNVVVRASAGTGVLIYAVTNCTEPQEDTMDDLGPVIVRAIHREAPREVEVMVRKAGRQWPKAPLYFFAERLLASATPSEPVEITFCAGALKPLLPEVADSSHLISSFNCRLTSQQRSFVQVRYTSAIDPMWTKPVLLEALL